MSLPAAIFSQLSNHTVHVQLNEKKARWLTPTFIIRFRKNDVKILFLITCELLDLQDPGGILFSPGNRAILVEPSYISTNPPQISVVFCNLCFTSVCASLCQVRSILCCIHCEPRLPDSSSHRHYNSHAARPQVQWRHYGMKHTCNTMKLTGYS